MKVLDNFLAEEDYTKIVQIFNNGHWMYNSMVVHDNESDLHNYQFVFPIWKEGWIWNHEIVNIFSRYINPAAWVRIKANFSPKRQEIYENTLHIDNNFGDWTGIYYVNNNNGYSYFYSGKKVESVANRMVIFPRETMHSGTTSTDNHRIVINFNWIGTLVE